MSLERAMEIMDSAEIAVFKENSGFSLRSFGNSVFYPNEILTRFSQISDLEKISEFIESSGISGISEIQVLVKSKF